MYNTTIHSLFNVSQTKIIVNVKRIPHHVLPPRSSKSYGVVGWVAHKILVTAQRLNSSLPFGLGLVNNTNLISLRRFTEMRDHISQQFIILDQARLLSVPKVFCCGCVDITAIITGHHRKSQDLARSRLACSLCVFSHFMHHIFLSPALHFASQSVLELEVPYEYQDHRSAN